MSQSAEALLDFVRNEYMDLAEGLRFYADDNEAKATEVEEAEHGVVGQMVATMLRESAKARRDRAERLLQLIEEDYEENVDDLLDY